jgi:hypothetical protein
LALSVPDEGYSKNRIPLSVNHYGYYVKASFAMIVNIENLIDITPYYSEPV